jgi:hypothetical protein
MPADDSLRNDAPPEVRPVPGLLLLIVATVSVLPV